MHLLKFGIKIVQLKATSFSLQFKLVTNLCKREIAKNKFSSIYYEVFSVTWPNFTIVKYNSKISIIYHQIKILKRYNEQVFNKKAALKNFAIFTEKHLRSSLFLNKNVGLQSRNFIKNRLQRNTCFGEHV